MPGGPRCAHGRSPGRTRVPDRGRLPIRTAAARGCPSGAGSTSRRQLRAMAGPGSRRKRRGPFPFREYRCPCAGVRHWRPCHGRRRRGHCHGRTRPRSRSPRTGWIPLRRRRTPCRLNRGHRCYRLDGHGRNPRRAATSCRLRPLSPTSRTVHTHKNKRAAPRHGGRPSNGARRCPTLPRGLPRSTIGAGGLNFRVRNGSGCFPFAVAAATLWSYGPGLGAGRVSRTAQWTRSMLACSELGVVPSPRPVSTGQLHPLRGFHFRPINPVVWLGALPTRGGGRPGLEAGFPLRCFQRLSLPDVANQPCPWRDNWHTRGPSVPVLSY